MDIGFGNGAFVMGFGPEGWNGFMLIKGFEGNCSFPMLSPWWAGEIGQHDDFIQILLLLQTF